MVMPKARTMLFDQWWREWVIVDASAETPHRELYRHYRRWGHATGMGEQAFTARLNEMSIGQRKERGIRYRLGVRLRTAGTMEEETAPVDAPPPVRTAPAGEIDVGEVRIAVPPPRAALFRLSPIVPGSGETSLGLMLEIAGPEDEASARVAEEVFAERRRQRAPKEAGGEAWTVAHDDDAHRAGELEGAACAYAYAASLRDDHAPFLDLSAKRPRPPIRTGWLVVDFLWQVWPWSPAWWKPDLDAPGWRRRCLVKAGALIIAAIEKLDRQAARDALSADERKQATGV